MKTLSESIIGRRSSQMPHLPLEYGDVIKIWEKYNAGIFIYLDKDTCDKIFKTLRMRDRAPESGLFMNADCSYKAEDFIKTYPYSSNDPNIEVMCRLDYVSDYKNYDKLRKLGGLLKRYK